ncbi:MAG: alpha/beta hydrolase [Rhodospirillales bacterium]
MTDETGASAEPEANQHLTAADGETIAYRRTAGRGPGVVFCTGYKSDMTGQKAMRLEEFCRDRGLAYVRFDYYGHGESSGDFVDGTIGRWRDDAVLVLDQMTEGPQVVVGSSLGGWIALLVALARPQRVAGLIGVAAAPDFTEDLIPLVLSPGDRAVLAAGGVVEMRDCDGGEPTPVKQRFLDEGREHLLLRAEIGIDAPVRLIHGMLDRDVPWKTALRLCERLRSPDVTVTAIKDAEHRLSRPQDLDCLTDALSILLRQLEAKAPT